MTFWIPLFHVRGAKGSTCSGGIEEQPRQEISLPDPFYSNLELGNHRWYGTEHFPDEKAGSEVGCFWVVI